MDMVGRGSARPTYQLLPWSPGWRTQPIACRSPLDTALEVLGRVLQEGHSSLGSRLPVDPMADLPGRPNSIKAMEVEDQLCLAEHLPQRLDSWTPLTCFEFLYAYTYTLGVQFDYKRKV